MTSSSVPPEIALGTAALFNDAVDSLDSISFAKQVEQGWETVCNDDGTQGLGLFDDGTFGQDMFETVFTDDGLTLTKFQGTIFRTMSLLSARVMWSSGVQTLRDEMTPLRSVRTQNMSLNKVFREMQLL